MYFILKHFKNLLACAYLQYVSFFSTVHLRSQHRSSEQSMQSENFLCLQSHRAINWCVIVLRQLPKTEEQYSTVIIRKKTRRGSVWVTQREGERRRVAPLVLLQKNDDIFKSSNAFKVM